MADVTRQLGSTRISPLVLAVAASAAIAAAIASLIGVGPLTGAATKEPVPLRNEGSLPSVAVKPRTGTCSLCGTIESIRTIEVLDQASAPVATADPPKSGAESSERSATSVLDTLSSVVTGSAADKNNMRKRLVYRVTLRMDDGSFRTISQPNPPAFTVGDKVRVVEGRLVGA